MIHCGAITFHRYCDSSTGYRRRVDFQIAVLVFQCLTGQAPGYLALDCHADVSAR